MSSRCQVLNFKEYLRDYDSSRDYDRDHIPHDAHRRLHAHAHRLLAALEYELGEQTPDHRHTYKRN